MQVAVTGGTGFVGAHAVRALVEAGHHVRLLARSDRAAAASLDPLGVDRAAYELVRGDVCDPEAVDRLLHGAEALAHCAGVVGVDDRAEADMWRVNVHATATVLTKAVAAGLDPIVHLASYSALFPAPTELIGPDSPITEGRSAYARTKAAGARIARGFGDAGAPVVVLYPSGIVGPPAGPRAGLAADGWAPLLRFGVSVSFPGGMALIDVRDVAELIAKVMVPGGGPQQLVCGGETLTFDEIVDELSAATGRRIRRVPISARTLKGIGRAVDAVSKVAPVPPVFTYEAAWLLTTAQRTDDTAALEALGHPWTSTRQALRDAVVTST
jgi:dihydroflavonol-4-reductase